MLFRSIRDVERRIQVTEKSEIALAAPVLPDELPDTFEEHAKMIWDLQVLAFQGDITRVASTLIGREQGSRSYTKSGITDGHHGTSHHQNDPEKKAKLSKITAYLMKQPAYFFERLKSIKEGDATLLDNSLFLVGGGLGDRPRAGAAVGAPVPGGGVARDQPHPPGLLGRARDRPHLRVIQFQLGLGVTPLVP